MVLRSRAIYQVKELVCVPALCRFCRRSRVTSPLRPRARAESVTSACRVLARPAGCRRDPIPGIQPARTPPPAGGRRRLDSGGAARPRSAAAVSSPAARRTGGRVPPGRSAWDPPAAVAGSAPSFLPPSICRCRVVAVSFAVGWPGLDRPGRTRARQASCSTATPGRRPSSSCARVAGRGAPCIAARVRASSRTCAAVHVYSYILEM